MRKPVDRPARPTQRPPRRLMLLWNLLRSPRFWIVEAPQTNEDGSPKRPSRRRQEWVYKPSNAGTSATNGDPLLFLSREQIIAAYRTACEDVWGGEIPPGYESRFTRWHLS